MRDHEIAMQIAMKRNHERPTLRDQMDAEIIACDEMLERTAEICGHIHANVFSVDSEGMWKLRGMFPEAVKCFDEARDMLDAAKKLYEACGVRDMKRVPRCNLRNRISEELGCDEYDLVLSINDDFDYLERFVSGEERNLRWIHGCLYDD